MASFFGEIVEPTSRAIYEDYCEEPEVPCDIKTRLTWIDDDIKQNKSSLVFDVMFIFHGRLTLAFAETFLINDESSHFAEIHHFEECEPSCREHSELKRTPCRLYANGKIGLCLVSQTLPNESGHAFMEILSPFLENTTKVIIFTNSKFFNLKMDCMDDLPIALMKELKTSHNKSDYVVGKLAIPSFIVGIPAAVLTWCEIFEKDASGLICFTDEEQLDSVTSAPYLKVLKKLNYSDLVKTDKPEYDKPTFYGKPWLIGPSSNIYI